MVEGETGDTTADADAQTVKQTFEDLREAAKAYTVDDIKNGNWFVRLLHHALDSYAKKVNAEYFRKKYPGLPPDVVVDRQIELAKRYALIEGGLSAGAYSGAVALTIGAGGGPSPLTLPAAALSFVADLTFTSQLQLRLAYDMAVLYGVPIDMNDPEDLIDLLKVAFGIKAAELARDALAKLGPEAVRQGVKGVFKGAALEFLKALPVVGKYLLQRNIIKFAIPLVNIPLSAGMNYWWTGAIAKRARTIYRNRAALNEEALKLVNSLDDNASLLVRTLWFITNADGKVAEGEATLLRSVAKHLADHGHADVLDELGATISLDTTTLVAEIKALSDDVRAHLFHAAVMGAAADHELQTAELKALTMLAESCGAAFEPADVKREIQRLKGATT